jgi:hypothetical protein
MNVGLQKIIHNGGRISLQSPGGGERVKPRGGKRLMNIN